MFKPVVVKLGSKVTFLYCKLAYIKCTFTSANVILHTSFSHTSTSHKKEKPKKTFFLCAINVLLLIKIKYTFQVSFFEHLNIYSEVSTKGSNNLNNICIICELMFSFSF